MYEPNSGSSLLAGTPLLVFVAMYLYYSFCQYIIAQKIGHKSPWWSFIPILNIYQSVELAHKPWWYFLLFFVPIANIVFLAIVWMEIAKNRGKAPAWGIMMLLPFVNFVALAFLAAGPSTNPYTEAQYAKPKEQDRVNVG
jgi:hypothetical protein